MGVAKIKTKQRSIYLHSRNSDFPLYFSFFLFSSFLSCIAKCVTALEHIICSCVFAAFAGSADKSASRFRLFFRCLIFCFVVFRFFVDIYINIFLLFFCC